LRNEYWRKREGNKGAKEIKETKKEIIFTAISDGSCNVNNIKKLSKF
jgi:hypothetical protein